MIRTIALFFFFVTQMSLYAQNAEPVNSPNKEFLYGKWLMKKITSVNYKNKFQHVTEVPGMDKYFYDFKNDGNFNYNLPGGKGIVGSGTWVVSEDVKILTLTTINSKAKAKEKKEYTGSYSIVKLTESELKIKEEIESKEGKGSIEYLYMKFDPNHKQSTVELKFYNSLEDFANEKFIKKYDIVEWSDSDFSSESIKYINDQGKEEKLKTDDFPTDFYTYGENTLYRRYKGISYKIIIAGAFSYYSEQTFSEDPRRYSETILGPIKKFSEGVLKDKLEEVGLLEAYKKDKPERKFIMDVQEFFNKQVAANIKYIKLLNARLAKKGKTK